MTDPAGESLSGDAATSPPTDRDYEPFDSSADDPVDLEWPEGLIRPPSPPYLVYLDQNHWVGLAQANVGHSNGDRYLDLLSVLRAGKQQGAVLVPLSGTHYMETVKIGSRRQRADLAAIMEELSDFRTLLSRAVIARLELETAIDHRLGGFLPQLGPVPLLGFGVNHALGVVPEIGLGADPRDESLERDRQRTLRFLDLLPGDWRRSFEQANLAGPQDDQTEDHLRARGWSPDAAVETARARAVQEAERATRLDVDPRWRRGRLRDFVGYGELSEEVLTPLVHALLRRGRTNLDGLFESRQSIRNFTRCMPSTAVAVEMKTHYHRNPQLGWESNTTFDIDAMAVSLPYCEVVLTERHACRTLRLSHLPEVMATEVLSKPEDLVTWLEAHFG